MAYLSGGGQEKNMYPILDTRISVRMCVTLRPTPLDSETGWTGELWSNPVLLILEGQKKPQPKAEALHRS